MKIERKIVEDLLVWKSSNDRKPLVLKGARQVGKTWLLKHFGEIAYTGYAYFNFEEQPEIKDFFKNTKDPKRIISNLSLVYGRAIEPKQTLIIFDEIQECNEALNSLKYFYENYPEYHVVSAGSLIGVALSRGNSFPVGKVDFLDIKPISFYEFLTASSPELAKYMDQINAIELIPSYFFNQFIDQLKKYFICGGMPKAVVTLLESQDIALVQSALLGIIESYRLDFSKHAENKTIHKIMHVWNSMPSQLAKENKKFLYQTVKEGARAREYEEALIWLEQAGLVYKIFRNKKPGIPLSAYDDLSAFKLYLFDVGILRRHASLDPIAIKEGNRLFVEFKGALSENFVLQGLQHQFEVMPRYWTSDGQAEVDFILQLQNDLVPIEVKSDENVRSKSLTYFTFKYGANLRVRYSFKNLNLDDGLLNIPLFLVDKTKKLLNML